MEIIYYEQLYIRNLFNQLKNARDEMIIHDDFLNNINREDFISAYKQLYQLYIQIYTDMMADPGGFDLPLFKIDEEKGADKTKSHYLSWIIIFLGMCGELDNKIRVNTKKFLINTKKFGVTNPLPLLNKLSNYGFHLTGIDKKKIIDPIFTVDYIDNKNIMHVIMALGKRMTQLNKHGNRYQLQRLSPRCFEDTSDILPGTDFNDYEAMLGDQTAVIEFFNSFMSEKGYTPFYEGFYRISYQKKKKLTTWYYCIQYKYWVEKEVTLQIRLYNLGKYAQFVENMPQSIKSVICQNTCRDDCKNKHECEKTVCYRVDGKQYKSCRWKTFDFINLPPDDFKYIRTLCENEWKIKNI
ncbi:MAG: hypothetical protein A2Y17_04950 [Clostridiales bacterium GWF2_38_85]|nr:MAG: hypothetical protein A2Y17_04950 [Clostridiales bacterium GWF2_38_85]HBL84364.1 hypothetical protein [Clostridiales bacterium]